MLTPLQCRVCMQVQGLKEPQPTLLLLNGHITVYHTVHHLQLYWLPVPLCTVAAAVPHLRQCCDASHVNAAGAQHAAVQGAAPTHSCCPGFHDTTDAHIHEYSLKAWTIHYAAGVSLDTHDTTTAPQAAIQASSQHLLAHAVADLSVTVPPHHICQSYHS